MSRQDRRLQHWLEARGWRTGHQGLWSHRSWAPNGGLPADDALRAQIAADRKAAAAVRDEDIRRADRGAEQDWRRAALATIHQVAEQHPELTTDDVLAANPALELGREKRALGPMMLHAARDGLIRPTDRYAPSCRRASNARHKRVWQSLVHGGLPPDPGRTTGLEILDGLQ